MGIVPQDHYYLLQGKNYNNEKKITILTNINFNR